MMIRARITITGIVHGVFFRSFVKEKANALSLVGYAKNTEEGVEIVVEGENPKIKRLIECCKQGPVGAKVKKLKIKYLQHMGEFKNFIIKY